MLAFGKSVKAMAWLSPAIILRKADFRRYCVPEMMAQHHRQFPVMRRRQRG